jgi:hypothetical protein
MTFLWSSILPIHPNGTLQHDLLPTTRYQPFPCAHSVLLVCNITSPPTTLYDWWVPAMRFNWPWPDYTLLPHVTNPHYRQGYRRHDILSIFLGTRAWFQPLVTFTKYIMTSNSLRAERSEDRIPVGWPDLPHPSDRPWDILNDGHRISSWGIRRPVLGVDHPHVSSANVKDATELHLLLPSGPSRRVLRWTLLC